MTGVNLGSEPDDLCEEFDDVTKESTEEVDTGFMKCSLFFIVPGS